MVPNAQTICNLGTITNACCLNSGFGPDISFGLG
jgi:hypothetical protein